MSIKEAFEDCQTHCRAWRKAIELAIAASIPSEPDFDDALYWKHELEAFDRTFDALATFQPDGERREAIARIIRNELLSLNLGCGEDVNIHDAIAIMREDSDVHIASELISDVSDWAAGAILASGLAQDEVLIALKRELEECKNAVATIEANRNPNSETQNGNYRFYQGRVVSLQFVIKVVEGK